MMTMLRGWITMIVMLTAINAQAACSWPAWEQFKKDYISQQGRVIDPGDAPTSEGQTVCRAHLAQGSLREHLPAWLWGKKIPTPGRCCSASDGDIWMAWSLLVVCGKRRVGTALLKRIAREEVEMCRGWAQCCYLAKSALPRE
ncbi:glycosyl hydrolase family 8 [Salmonella enterica]|uniref:glycosyl hydrolase family 8 n=1 Tax=Salmonella enterica TaxID=28901 RepID=UPI00244A41B6|nr:glycosyl hydrolase family 8 [Salmonella enterica]